MNHGCWQYIKISPINSIGNAQNCGLEQPEHSPTFSGTFWWATTCSWAEMAWESLLHASKPAAGKASWACWTMCLIHLCNTCSLLSWSVTAVYTIGYEALALDRYSICLYTPKYCCKPTDIRFGCENKRLFQMSSCFIPVTDGTVSVFLIAF